MKQKYIKPVLILESFELSQSVAHQCGEAIKGDWDEANLKSKNSCGWWIGDLDGDGRSDYIFVGVPQCTQQPNNPTEEELDKLAQEFGVCYNNPEGGYKVFNS